MALYFVNDNLIQEELAGDSSWPTGETYKRYMIRSAPFIKRQEDGETVEMTRPICAHNCSDDPRALTRITTVKHEDARTPKVTVRTSADTRYDSDIFVVAIPYDGMIKPIEHDEKALSIFKCVMVKSDRMSIPHEDRKYKRVVYLVVRPNYQYLGNDGWYGDECNLSITFAQSNRTRDNQSEEESKWTFKTVTVKFGANGQYDITSVEEEAPYDTFNPEDTREMPICHLVKPTIISEDGNGSNNNGGNFRKGNGSKRR